MTFEGPRIDSDERGFTINKTLAWTMTVALVLSSIYIGTIITESNERIAVLQIRQIEDRALITTNQSEINTLRRSSERVDQRIVGIEQSQQRQEAATNEILRYLRNSNDGKVPTP
jgi:Tfp pilus assembly protein PilN